MIKTQELKVQIEELTKQNDMMLLELEQMKRLISGGGSDSQGSSGGGQQGGQQQGGQMQGGGQQGGQQQDSRQAGGQEQGGQQLQLSGNNRQNQDKLQAGGGNSGQTAQLANDLLQIKDMVARLEQKTSQYVANQSGGLTDKDVVNLVLTLINGMVDWSSEYVSSHASGSGQQQ